MKDLPPPQNVLFTRTVESALGSYLVSSNCREPSSSVRLSLRVALFPGPCPALLLPLPRSQDSLIAPVSVSTKTLRSARLPAATPKYSGMGGGTGRGRPTATPPHKTVRVLRSCSAGWVGLSWAACAPTSEKLVTALTYPSLGTPSRSATHLPGLQGPVKKHGRQPCY